MPSVDNEGRLIQGREAGPLDTSKQGSFILIAVLRWAGDKVSIKRSEPRYDAEVNDIRSTLELGKKQLDNS